MHPGFSILLLLGSLSSVQLGATFAKRLFAQLGAEGTTALRCLIAAVILLAFWRPWRSSLTRAQMRAILFYGVALGCMNLTFYLAIARVPLGLAVAIEFSGPLAVALYGSRRPLDFLWALLAALGIFLLLPISPASSQLDPIGVGFALTAGVCWALYIVFGQRAGTGVHAGHTVALGMGVAALVVLPFGIAAEGAKLLDPAVWPPALLVGVLSGVLPYSLEMIALKRVPKKTFGILLSLAPAVAALAGFVVLGERLTALQWFAIASVVAASAGTSWTTHRARELEKSPRPE